MRAFIDDIHTVRIESLSIISKVEILNETLQWITTEGLFQWFKSLNPIQLQRAESIMIDGLSYPLNIGLVTLTDDFNRMYTYDGPLGAVYTISHTDFYVYSPVAKEIKLSLRNTMYPMKGDGVIYHVRVDGDHAYQAYHYNIRLHETFVVAQDPYVELTSDSKGFVNPKNIVSEVIQLKHVDPLDVVIYEIHVRDATIHLDIPNKGLFRGFTEKSSLLNGSVLDYIASLGVSHIQLLPVFDFEGVDSLNPNIQYNWGYNPKHYFSLQPWFSSNPSNPGITALEFKQMVDAIHHKGIKVVMDVVFNHVYDYLTYPYDAFVPGYFYRHDEDYKMTNGSYCGNEVETRRYMVRRLIIDALSHFVDTYQMDGFRFDLMGLMDIETMQMITKRLQSLNPNILLYGEGWHMGTMLFDHERASLRNYSKMPDIAHFNDTFRNHVKGELHGKGLGYATGGKVDLKDVIRLLEGSIHVFNHPKFSINYVECHDNSTLYDKLFADLEDHKNIKSYIHLSNSLVALAKGLSFFHAGQEMFRTKKGVENSYRSSDDINGMMYDIGEHTQFFSRLIFFKSYTKNFNRQYTIINDTLHMSLSNDEENFHAIFKFDHKPYTYDTRWGILYLTSSPLQDAYIVEPGLYVFKH